MNMPTVTVPPIVTESRNLVRKRVFQVASMEELRDLLETLKGEKFTGSVKVNVSQGRAKWAEAEEAHALPAM